MLKPEIGSPGNLMEFYLDFDRYFVDKNIFFPLFGNYPIINNETKKIDILQQNTEDSWHNFSRVLGEEKSVGIMIKLRKELGEEVIKCVDLFVEAVNNDGDHRALHTRNPLFIIQVLCKQYVGTGTYHPGWKKSSKWRCMKKIIEYERHFERKNNLKSPPQEYWYGSGDEYNLGRFTVEGLRNNKKLASNVLKYETRLLRDSGIHDDDIEKYFNSQEYQNLLDKLEQIEEELIPSHGYHRKDSDDDYSFTLFQNRYYRQAEPQPDTIRSLEVKRREFFLELFLKIANIYYLEMT